jgi:tetratricopeptide (TPR) repeat protein
MTIPLRADHPIAIPKEARRARISVCMIVKDEEANIGACLESLLDLADEIVVVDTGSSDRTKEIAARYGVCLYEFPWLDSFAAARNECIRKASGDWLFLYDADDRIDAENRAKLRALFARLGDENAAYVMKIRSKTDPAGWSVRLLDQVRLFRNDPEVRWEYRVHEQILPAVTRCGGAARWTDVIIDHAGYQEPAQRRRKLERNLKLLLLEQKERPDDPFTLFNLGRTYRDLDCSSESMDLFRRSLKIAAADLSIVRKLYALLTTGYQQQNEIVAAVTTCKEGLARFPDDAELLFQQSILLRKQGNLVGAETSLNRLLKSRAAEYFDMVDVGIRTYKARHQLGLVYLDQARSAEAEVQWRRAIAERPDFVPALLSLGDLLLEQKRWIEVEETAAKLETASKAVEEPALNASLLRARAQLARKEFTLARQRLEETCSLAPRALVPHLLLSRLLLEEGRDWAAAKKTLHHLLSLDPHHAEARHNLAVLEKREAAQSRVNPP